MGVVSKPKVIGRWKYKQRKTDYILEEELSGNLRQAQPLTNDQLLHDRFDSVFRRNLVEPHEAIYDHRRRKHKQDFKFYRPVGTKTKEL